MGNKSKIEWTEATWNPVTGCKKISPGCKNCYAERMAKRLQAMGQERYRNGFDVTLQEDVLEQPLRWKRPRMIFVNSMSDLFHKEVSFSFIDKAFDVMWRTPRHTYQILTKRPGRMVEYISKRANRKHFDWTDWGRNPIYPGDFIHYNDMTMRNTCGYVGYRQDREWVCNHPRNEKKGQELSCSHRECPIASSVYRIEQLKEIGIEGQYECDENGYVIYEDECEWMEIDNRPKHAACGNVWLGFSAEDQKTFDARAKEFRSLRYYLGPHFNLFCSLEPLLGPIDVSAMLKTFDYQEGSHHHFVPYLNWIICGGESGPHARPMHPNWVRSLRDQCVQAGVPFFFKQWGEWYHDPRMFQNK